MEDHEWNLTYAENALLRALSLNNGFRILFREFRFNK